VGIGHASQTSRPAKYYAVLTSSMAAVFASWEEAKPHVNRVPGAEHKSFGNLNEARAWLLEAESRRAQEQASASTQSAHSQRANCMDVAPPIMERTMPARPGTTANSWAPVGDQLTAIQKMLADHDNQLKQMAEGLVEVKTWASSQGAASTAERRQVSAVAGLGEREVDAAMAAAISVAQEEAEKSENYVGRKGPFSGTRAAAAQDHREA
jgi:Caulimovirus viroplasmin